jgi:molecular chaperone GrpE
MSKKKETKIEETQPSVETENESTKVDSTKLLTDEIAKLNAYIFEKDKRITTLEDQIKQINQEYVGKVQEKTEQANVQLKQKMDELNIKAAQELENIKKYGLEKQLGSLIDIVSQFEMALSYKPTDEKIANYQSGFMMFLNMLKNLLIELHVNEININVGDEFNAEYMECIEFVPNPQLKDNHVAKIITKGYRLHDRVIKTAVVYVVRN